METLGNIFSGKRTEDRFVEAVKDVRRDARWSRM
jgi:hypothetical protein